MASVDVPARRSNPPDEDLLVSERETFDQLTAGHQTGQLYDIHYRSLLAKARPIHRMMDEEDHQLVQLIPSFLVFEDDRVLSFRRTRKTPEQRLHARSSIVFGGHLQAEDNPPLFAHDDEAVESFLFRALHEEPGFSPPPRHPHSVAVLTITASAFDRP